MLGSFLCQGDHLGKFVKYFILLQIISVGALIVILLSIYTSVGITNMPIRAATNTNRINMPRYFNIFI
jgi:hypothetical protein